MRRSSATFRPFATRGKRTIAAILLTFALFSAVSVGLSTWAASRSQHRATIVEVAARQRTLAERYVNGVLLVRQGRQADPTTTARVLAESARVLLEGGLVPSVEGDDDKTTLSPTTDATARAQLKQAQRLVNDLTATGSAVLAHRPVTSVRLTANERVKTDDPITRLRVLAGLTSNVSLNAARTIATRTDQNVGQLTQLQVVLGLAGLTVSMLLALALIATTRRQTAHFRSIVNSSTDLVLVLGAEERCRYASHSVVEMMGCGGAELLSDGFTRFVHPGDRDVVGCGGR